MELRVKELREDAEIEPLFRKVETFGLAFIPEEFLEGRSRKIPKMLDNTNILIEATERLGGASSNEKGISELRRSYVEVVDSIMMSAEERFNQQDLGILKQIEHLILGSINGKRIKNRACIISAIATRFASVTNLIIILLLILMCPLVSQAYGTSVVCLVVSGTCNSGIPCLVVLGACDATTYKCMSSING